MNYKPMTVEELQACYGKKFVRLEGDGYYVRSVGREGYYNKPNIQIHVPKMGLPTQDGLLVDLFKGFNMPEILRIMHIESENSMGILFCRDFRIVHEHGRDVCHLTLCDPSESSSLLIVTEYAAIESATKTEEPVAKTCDCALFRNWAFRIRYRSNGRIEENKYYEVVPLGCCYREGRDETEVQHSQTEEERLAIMQAVIKAADSYLDSDASLSQVEAAEEKEAPSSLDDWSKKLLEIPGINSLKEGLRSWCYEDDLNLCQTFVVDACGRQLKPRIEDRRELFDGEDVKCAEFRNWPHLPSDALALRLAITVIGNKFEVLVRPACVTPAQRHRVNKLYSELYNKCERVLQLPCVPQWEL